MTVPLAILTVVRNDLAGLLATRASLRAQTIQDFEWIIVDGASTDGTAEWLRRHGGEASWWRSAPDRGLYDAMNIALEAASADAVLFLNAGDRLAAADTIERLTGALASATETDLFYGDALERLADGRTVRKAARSHRLSAIGMFTHHQSMLYRRSAVRTIRFDLRYELAADYDFTLRALGEARSVQRLSFPVCLFAPGGISQRETRRGRDEQALIRRELLGYGVTATAAIKAAQWLAQSVRRCAPAIYARWRFTSSETLFPSR